MTTAMPDPMPDPTVDDQCPGGHPLHWHRTGPACKFEIRRPDPTACAEGAKYAVGQRIEQPCSACGHPLHWHRPSSPSRRLPCPACEFELRLRNIEDALLKTPGIRFYLALPRSTDGD